MMYRFNKTGLLLARFASTYLNSPHGGGGVLRYGLHSRKVVRLTCDSTAKGGICQVYLVGTVHDQQKYCRLVKDVVNFVKPQVVFLELCSERTHYLEPHKPDCLYDFTLLRIYLYQLVVISEFQVAFEEAQKYGATIILGDRPIEITKKRLNRKLAEMTRWHWIKYFFPYKLWQITDKILRYYYADMIKNEEEKFLIYNVGILQWIRCFQILYETDVDERDQYMSAMLLKVASEHESVVAIMGCGHLPGIQKYWKQNIKAILNLYSSVMLYMECLADTWRSNLMCFGLLGSNCGNVLRESFGAMVFALEDIIRCFNIEHKQNIHSEPITVE